MGVGKPVGSSEVPSLTASSVTTLGVKSKPFG